MLFFARINVVSARILGGQLPPPDPPSPTPMEVAFVPGLITLDGGLDVRSNPFRGAMVGSGMAALPHPKHDPGVWKPSLDWSCDLNYLQKMVRIKVRVMLRYS